MWPIITNTEALNISQTYHLHPGFLVSSKNATNHTVPGPPPPPAPKAYVSALPSDGLAPQQWSQTSTGVRLIHASISPCVSTCVLRKPSSSICHARLIPQVLFFLLAVCTILCFFFRRCAKVGAASASQLRRSRRNSRCRWWRVMDRSVCSLHLAHTLHRGL